MKSSAVERRTNPKREHFGTALLAFAAALDAAHRLAPGEALVHSGRLSVAARALGAEAHAWGVPPDRLLVVVREQLTSPSMGPLASDEGFDDRQEALRQALAGYYARHARFGWPE